MTDTSGTASPLPPATGSRYAPLEPRTAPDVAGDILRGADDRAIPVRPSGLRKMAMQHRETCHI
jgi:hypothetical protein